MEPDDTPTQGPEPTEPQCMNAIFAVYFAMSDIASKASEGAAPWELVRRLAMMVDEMDRTLKWCVLGVATDLWSASDALRAEAQDSRAQRPPELEGEP